VEEKRLATDLSLMLESAVAVLQVEDIASATHDAAEDCIRSLLKSMAILGYDEVIDNKEHQ